MIKSITCPGCGGGKPSLCQTCKGKGTIETYFVDYKTLPISYEAQSKLFDRNIPEDIKSKFFKEFNNIILNKGE